MSPSAAEKPQSAPTIEQLLTRFAAEVPQEYPKLQDQFILIDARRGRAYQHFDLSRYACLTPENFAASVQEFTQGAVEAKVSWAGPLRIPVDSTTDNYVGQAIAFNVPTPDVLSREDQLAAFFTLFHELGHLVVPEAGQFGKDPDGHYKEIAADIYSLARLQKKFGSGAANYIAQITVLTATDDFIRKDDRIHMTLFAVAEFMQLRDKLDFAAMTLDGIATLSSRLALKHTLSPFVSQQVSAQFNEYREEVKTDPVAAIEKLADKIATADPLTCRIGRTYLDTFLRDDLIFPYGDRPVLDAPARRHLAEKLRAKDFEINAEDITAGLPRKKAPEQNNAPMQKTGIGGM